MEELPVTIITTDMRVVIESAHLCFAATVSPDGWPNLSPKGTIRVWDDAHLFFLDIASPVTAANLTLSDRIVLNVVEQKSRRGYRFSGRGTLHRDDAVYASATRRVFEEEGAEYPVKHVVLIAVDRAEMLASPGYAHFPSERQMRDYWSVRRAELDRAYEAHIAQAGAWRPPS
jgi:predicted pyridoxine 5'-phosphate oxidase superfamily flavin-nucleotide-binding protein